MLTTCALAGFSIAFPLLAVCAVKRPEFTITVLACPLTCCQRDRLFTLYAIYVEATNGECASSCGCFCHCIPIKAQYSVNDINRRIHKVLIAAKQAHLMRRKCVLPYARL